MKRILIAVIALLLIMTVFMACDDDNGGGTDTTVGDDTTIAAPDTTTIPNPPETVKPDETTPPETTPPETVHQHKEQVIPAVAATCTASGLTEGKKCSECNEIIVAQQPVAALGHDEVAHSSKAATCETAGWRAYKTCTRCSYTTYSRVAAKGHSEQIVAGTPATCTTAGLSDGKKCTVCGKTTVAQQTIAALGHTEVAHAAKEATCTDIGWNAYVTCNKCNYTTYAEIPAKGHTEQVTPGTPATCTTSGVSDGRVCTVCNTVLAQPNPVPAIGHTYGADDKCTACSAAKPAAGHAHTEQAVAAVAPTCVLTGLTEGKICSECGEIIVKQDIVDALGHTEAVIPAQAPTCTQTGLTEGKKCSVCNEIFVPQQTVAATGHTVVVDAAVAPTCTQEGKAEGSHCSVCQEVLIAQATVPATGHTEVIDEAEAPTCTETGLTEGKHCSVCQEVLIAQNTVDATGHTEAKINGTAPTCTETGLTDGKKCSVCQAVLENQNVIDALGHNYAAPTYTWANDNSACTAERVCGRDNTHKESETVTAAKSVTQAQACDKEEISTFTATFTNAAFVTQTQENVKTADALGHTYGELVVKVNATCTETGMQEHYLCSVCETYFTSAKAATTKEALVIAIDATAHVYGAPKYTWAADNSACTAERVCTLNGEHKESENATIAKSVTQQKTCDNDELTTFTATFTNAAFATQTKENVKTADKLGHDYGTPTYIWANDNSACTAERVCGRDNAHKESETVTAAKSVTQAQTCDKEEISTFTATFTNAAFEKQTQENVKTADALGHTYGELVAKVNATCTETGMQEHYLCSVCETYFTSAKEATTKEALVIAIDATAHVYAATTYTWTDDNSTCIAARECSRDCCGYSEFNSVGTDKNVTQVQTCDNDELTTFTATFTNAAFEKQTKENVKTADKLGHDYGTPTYTWANDNSTCTAERVCGRNDTHKESETVTAAKNVTQAQACEKEELTKFTATFENDAFATQTQENIKTADAAGHSTNYVLPKQPTCTEAGWNAYEYCTKCDYNGKVEIPATNHVGTLVQVTAKAPTCTEGGYDAYEYCTKCSYTTRVDKNALNHEFGADHKCTRANCDAVDPNPTHIYDKADHKCACGVADPNPTHKYDETTHKCELCSKVDPATLPNIAVEKITAKAGETVEVRILIKNNPGVAGALLTLSYDSGLTIDPERKQNQELVNLTPGEAFDVLDFTHPANVESGMCNMQWDTMNAESNVDGTIMTIKFTVSSTAEVGDELEISISYKTGDVYGFDDSFEIINVDFELIAGSITVVE